MPADDRIYWVAWSKIHCIGPVKFEKLRSFFPSLKDAWRAHTAEFAALGFEAALREKISIQKKEIDPEEEYIKIQKTGVSLLTLEDPSYPRLLKEIHAPPPVLFYRGKLIRDAFALAVVGTRKISSYGKEVTRDIASKICEAGVAIVSGLALGADTVAHEAALSAHGATWAVLGGGVDDASIYPAQNFHLAKKILEAGGAVLSEYVPGTHPQKMFFPLRNRIISGLSQGVLVSEAPQNSGALITARYALEQNREVFAVPGSIYSQNSRGTNRLIRMGATLVTCAQDIFHSLNISADSPRETRGSMPTLTDAEAQILDILQNEPRHIDFLIQESRLPASGVHAALTTLELGGMVKNLGNNTYSASKNSFQV